MDTNPSESDTDLFDTRLTEMLILNYSCSSSPPPPQHIPTSSHASPVEKEKETNYNPLAAPYSSPPPPPSSSPSPPLSSLSHANYISTPTFLNPSIEAGGTSYKDLLRIIDKPHSTESYSTHVFRYTFMEDLFEVLFHIKRRNTTIRSEVSKRCSIQYTAHNQPT